jgi:hypothetical protein
MRTVPIPSKPAPSRWWLEFTKAAAEARADWQAADDDQAAIHEVDKLITAAGLRGTITRAKPEQANGETETPRRKRSTRRRQEAPELPRRKMTARTIGRTFEGNGGRIYRPSTFLTLTLDSYGRVREDGSPVDMNSYDYRRAAWDAVHFPHLLDRFWQNLRRAAGYNVQYAGSVAARTCQGRRRLGGAAPKIDSVHRADHRT